ncbi:alpha-1,2-fucosyltransferase [Paenibacillus sonchi]|uniref:Alpha-1,2-fucosyltransferase n=2 Tax=Paenibacillus sonchi TaxID=373687 RepID=A0A974SCM9_9BACL|nr:alpha-1,2-fucosyltransferase [Paenibacillus sonchi]QQZ61618.1 alpha-1,2-fucosyltransferase [Paenibacillus sonchi]
MSKKKKIIIRVMGGLGNQLFQYAYARYLQELYNADIYLDLRGYQNYKVREFSLNKFQLNDRVNIFSEAMVTRNDRYRYGLTRRIYHIVQFMIKKITRKNKMGTLLFHLMAKGGYFYNFDVFYYPTPKYSGKKDIFVYGYFQSPFYFEAVKEVLLNELVVKKDFLSKTQNIVEEVMSVNSVAVSIRCGEDYLNSNLNVFSERYFYEGIDYIKKRVNNIKIYIFSDDINKCKNLFSFGQEVTYIEGVSDYEGITIMSKCKHFIISNSSFSWFGAYLSNYEEKIVIAPEKWYKNKKEGEDIYFPNMIRM